MPLINIKYDNEKVDASDVKVLSEGVQKIVSKITGIEDVFVYADSSEIKIKIAPIEVFIQMSANKINNQDKLMAEIKSALIDWKSKNKFLYPINLTLIPMNWKVEIGI